MVELTDSELNADMAKYLTDDEKAKAKDYKKKITDWVLSCMDTEKTASLYIAPQHSIWIISSMSGVKYLLKKLYKRKREAEEAELNSNQIHGKIKRGCIILS